MKTKITLLFIAVAVISLLLTYGPRTTKAAATLIVDDDSVCPGATFTSIQAAVTAAAPGDTVQVCAGNYAESVSINKALTLNGAQAGNAVAGRTFAGAGESTVTGQTTIQAAGVTMDGFSLTNPGAADANRLNILVKTAGDNAVIKNNIIANVGSATNSFFGGTHAIYLETGPDGVQISDNSISNIQHAQRSSSAIFIGDSVSPNQSQNVLISGNTISQIVTGNRGAYGIIVNNGAGTPGLQILDNSIQNLTGGNWAHAIGLEGDTPGVIVMGNSISNVVDANPTPIPDAIAVFFEANPSFSTAEVHNNQFNVTPATFGIAVHPALSGGSVDGTCNWWNAANGPGPVGPGSGAGVSPNVTFSPWQTSPGGPCVGPDGDGDGITDADDNCPTVANSDQANNDGDALGDVCDPDDDNDGVADGMDNCQFTPNTNQANNDGDVLGDVCDPDDDNDGVADNADNCQFIANPGQENTDGDALGNACDPDDDNDGVLDNSDACPGTPSGTTVNASGCPLAVNKDACKNNGWKMLFRANNTPFKNQGDCIQYVNTGK